MAEIVVSAVISVLCEKLIAGDLIKLAQSEGIDSKLNKWKKTLLQIQALLADAGKKHITESAVELWLFNLQDLAYHIDDVLDELATEALRRKLNQESHAMASTSTSTSKLFKFVPTCCTNFTPRNIVYGQQMSCKLDAITTKLDDLVEAKNGLGLNVNNVCNVNVKSSNKKERPREKTSLVDESTIIDRKGDREALLGKLLGSDEKTMSVMSIVGMGGIGKTTLAKALYNDDKVKNHFELRSWVCVSEDFNVFTICEAIFQKVNGKNEDFADLNLLHEALTEKLHKIRFLLVLDDVWNEDEDKWELLKSPLTGAPGSKIVVTTRNTGVASLMESDEVYHLDFLSDEDALSLFAQHALGEKNFDKHPSLRSHGEGIVKKCGRLPLALTTLGRALKKDRNGNKWEEMLKSEIWDIKDGKQILPALRLSYYHLPAHLKQLFASCSSYPKDYVFDKKELVLLWMAQGFLSQSHDNTSMESLGHEYFEELQSRSFFQHSTNEKLGYMMHDLVNDLAASVAGEFFFRLDADRDVSGRNENFENFRHFSLIGKESRSYRKLKELQRATHLRTLLLVPSDWARDDTLGNALANLFPKLKFLRVLSVTWCITKVPESIGSLKHLRYLNFSNSAIRFLPEQVSELYNLQTLLLRGCIHLSSLPESFVKLINMRHLDLSMTVGLKKMPLGIGGLTRLQTLPKVIIEGLNGFKISDLKGLPDLQGQLTIMELNKVINAAQAKDANLHRIKGIDVLEMQWSHLFDDSRDEMVEYGVLEELRPHHKLGNLKILYNKGARFPSWVGDPSYDRLTELTLYGCRSTHLPTLGQLSSLEKLFVTSMDEVKTLGLEFLAPANSNILSAFPSLKVLKFELLRAWEKWSASGGDNNGTGRWFPRLHEISIINCGKLAEVSIGSIPSLQVLRIEGCSEVVLRDMVSVSSSLVALTILDVRGLTQLHGKDLMQLGSVKNLDIEYCNQLRYLWEQEWKTCKILPSLQKLEVCHCTQLVSLGEKEVNKGIIMESIKELMIVRNFAMESYTCPRSIERLRLFYCGSVTSLTFTTSQELLASLTELVIHHCDNIKTIQQNDFGFLHMFCLRHLEIDSCKNLKSFPHMHFQSLTALEELSIRDCPSMDYSFPCGMWPPNLSILSIGRLNKPMSEWGHQNFPTSLVKLRLYGQNSEVVTFAVAEDVRNSNTTTSTSFLLPPSLVELTLTEFEDVESLSEVLQHLPCLKRLEIYSCPKLKDLPATIFYPSSSIVKAWKAKKIESHCVVYVLDAMAR